MTTISTSVFYEKERQSYTFLLGHWCIKPDGNWHEMGDEKKMPVKIKSRLGYLISHLCFSTDFSCGFRHVI